MQSKPLSYNQHDVKVIAFQVLIAALQAGLLSLGTYNFGVYTPYVVGIVQVLSEAMRRFVVA